MKNSKKIAGRKMEPVPSEVDFTNPVTLLLQLKANDCDSILYCPRAAIKTSRLNQVSTSDVVTLNVPFQDLLTFLKVVNADIFEIISSLSTAQKKALIRTSRECGLSLGNAFDSFAVLCDAIFDASFGDIPWVAWAEVARRHSLNMKKEDDAYILMDYEEEARLEAPEVLRKEAARMAELNAIVEKLEPAVQPPAVVHTEPLVEAARAVFGDMVDPAIEQQAWNIWCEVARRHGLDMTNINDVHTLVSDHLEEVKLQAKAIGNQIKYDDRSLAHWLMMRNRAQRK